MSQTTSTVALMELAGHPMRLCTVCGTYIRAELPGDRCAECGGPSSHPTPEWLDVTDLYGVTFPAPIVIVVAAHLGVNRGPRRSTEVSTGGAGQGVIPWPSFHSRARRV
jgi:rRNA maturation protein Nop10